MVVVVSLDIQYQTTYMDVSSVTKGIARINSEVTNMLYEMIVGSRR